MKIDAKLNINHETPTHDNDTYLTRGSDTSLTCDTDTVLQC